MKNFIIDDSHIEVLISDDDTTICVYCGVKISDNPDDEVCICGSCCDKYYSFPKK